ncbi:HIT domain-containing protein [Candidatus Saccharibacteria bacterium]|nr:HIT domain-containing protein [Candidatus Saccharibacteria bacterium]
MKNRVSIYDTRRVQRQKDKYYALHQADSCAFCDYTTNSDQIIKLTDHFYVIRNKFPYDWFDLQGVKTHYLLIPKRHVVSFNELNNAERAEYMDIIGDYEAKGFTVFTRASNNHVRSVAHLHTHLIKTDGKRRGTNIVLILGKLGIRIVK